MAMNSALTKSLGAIGLITALAVPLHAYGAGHSASTSAKPQGQNSNSTSAKPQVQNSNIMKTKHDTVKNSISNVR